jgi:citronellol/citronellal dehydrogenase
VIATAAVMNLLGGEEVIAASRKPDILADAAHLIFTKDSRSFTGNFCIDEELLRAHGVTDFSQYLMTPGTEPLPDYFLD